MIQILVEYLGNDVIKARDPPGHSWQELPDFPSDRRHVPWTLELHSCFVLLRIPLSTVSYALKGIVGAVIRIQREDSTLLVFSVS